MKLYSIFQVKDYKGGELCADINKTSDEVVYFFKNKIEDCLENFDDFEELCTDIESYKKHVYDFVYDDCNFYESYAGTGGGFCGDVYEHKDGKLELVRIDGFLKAAIKLLAEEFFNNEGE